MIQLTTKTNGLIQDDVRRGDGLPNARNGKATATVRVDFCGSPRDAGRFRGGKQAVRAAWPPDDRENHR